MDRNSLYQGCGRKGNPLFLGRLVSYPHLAVLAGPEYKGLYPELSEDRQHYFGSITAMDEQIGRLRGTLRELRLAEDTIIWFCSDNGPDGREQAGRTQGSAGPFKGRKRSLYEGGIRVPSVLECLRNLGKAGKRTSLYRPVTSSPPFWRFLGMKIRGLYILWTEPTFILFCSMD